VRLGVLDRRCWRSARARSKELRGWRTVEGERGVEVLDCCATFGLEKDNDLSDVGVDSSMTGGVP